jgi:hypothetical protein
MVRTKIQLDLFDSDNKKTGQQLYLNNLDNENYVNIVIEDKIIKLYLSELSRAIEALKASKSY